MTLEPASAARLSARLPRRLAPFVGRQTDLDALLQLLQDPSVRLVTISGIGGVGKTALALELARSLQDKFEHGAAFVPLAQLSSVDELLPAIAGALDVQLPPSGDLQQALLDHLAGLQLLLVLDSFEHLLDEAVLLRDILLAASRVKLLVTSREKLNLEAETLYSLDGLALPPLDHVEDIHEFDSIRLFLQRAHQARPGFSLNAGNTPAVVGLCRMVDGNPLGILLAASWVEHFSPAEIADEAGSSLDFLTRDLRDAEPRHSCLRAVFESSFRRLDPGQQAVFRRLSVFRGGFDLPAALAVADASLVALISLTEKSLLSRDLETGRYELHGLLRQYAAQELAAAGEHESARAAHAAYYRDFVRSREPHISSHLQAAALDELQADLDNLRQAWTWVIERRDFHSAGLMLPGLYAFCEMRSRFYEGEALFRQAVERLAPQGEEPPHGAWALALLSWYDLLLYFERPASFEPIIAQGRRCLDWARSVHDAPAIAASLALLGHIAQHQGDLKTAIHDYEAAVQACPALDDIYWLQIRVGLVYQADCQYEQALKAYERCLEHGRRTGENIKTGWALENMADVFMLQGKVGQSAAYAEQALALFQQVGSPVGVSWSTFTLARAAFASGDSARARELAQLSAKFAHQVHYPSWIQRTDALLQQLDPSLVVPSASPRPEDDSLSQRELDVLRLLKSELTGPEIARRLVVSLNTVRFHTKHIYQKLGVNNRLEAIRRARELGL